MIKILHVAWREFSSTALTKGFIIGIVLTPVMLLIVGGAIVLMKNIGAPRIVGTVAVVDRSGLVGERVTRRFDPEAIKKEAEDKEKKDAEAAVEAAKAIGVPPGQIEQAKGAMTEHSKQAAGASADLTLELLPPDADVEKEKTKVIDAEIKTSKTVGDGPRSRLALVVIPADAVKAPDGGAFGKVEAFYAKKLDFEVQGNIRNRVTDAVVDARLANDQRMAASGLKPEDVRRLVERPKVESKTVSKEGEKKTLGEAAFLLPMAFMILLMVSVFTSGQYLLTTTVEEKSSRVMEVLLSAVSPMQLMVGKIVGQMGVGLLILALYSGLGIASLVALARADLLDPMALVYLFIFFMIAYFLVASMMAAIGSAVNDMREAQTLMTPVMVVLMIPWLIWFVIQRAPNSMLATVLSFVPGTNPFVMVIRLSGSEPVPTWQIPVAILVGLASVVFAAWAAAKIFRIGVLMYGKPPNFKTLVKWVRMA